MQKACGAARKIALAAALHVPHGAPTPERGAQAGRATYISANPARTAQNPPPRSRPPRKAERKNRGDWCVTADAIGVTLVCAQISKVGTTGRELGNRRNRGGPPAGND